jgi:type I restriction enzyme S subunit
MSFPAYDEYKDSGVEWLGEVPENWTVCRVKSVADLVNGYPFDSKLFDSSDGMPIIRIRDLDKSIPETFYKGERVEAAVITSSDVLIGMDGNFNVGRWRGEGEALLNQRMCCIRGKDDLHTRILEYALPFPLKAINDVTFSTTVKHLSSIDVEKTRVAIPTDPSEQTALLEFLDTETSKIDSLVSEQRRLIELLKEKRQAVISHAVTKGLDPSVPMKESGIEWLGEVPEHWEVMRLRHACSHIFLGLTSKVDYVDDGGVPLVRALNIAGGKLDLSDVRCISKDQHASLTKRNRAMRDDVLLSKSGSIGTVAVVDTDVEFSIYESIFVLRSRADLLRSIYLLHLLRSQCCSNQFLASSVGMGVGHLNMSDIVDVYVALPPIDEQQEVGEFLDAEVHKFSQLQSQAERAIELLQERRTALISAAVTGKIDVREFATEAVA